MILGIYGTGGSGRELLEMIQRFGELSARWSEIVFIDDTKPIGEFRDFRTMPFDAFCTQYSPENAKVAIAVGEPCYRKSLAARVREAGYALATIIHPMAHVSPTASIGEGVIVRLGSILSADCSIKDNVWIQTYVTIGHDVVVGENSQISGNSFIAGHTCIGKNVYVGIAASVKEGVNIGDDSIVSMGAVVLGDFGPSSVIMGNPGRKISDNEAKRVFASGAVKPNCKVAAGDVVGLDGCDIEILDIISSAVNIPVVGLDRSSGVGKTTGWNSIAQMSIVMALESSYGISFSQEQLLRMMTVESIVREANACRIDAAVAHSPIVKRIAEIAAKNPDRIALIADDEKVSYKDLLNRILAAAEHIQSSGFKKGDTIALTATKKLDFIYAYFGAHVACVTVVVVDPESNPKKVEYIVGLTKPKATLKYEDFDFTSNRLPVPVPGASNQDVADIVFTTGTTGNPKGVCLTHFNIFSSASNINEYIGNGPDEVEVLGLPLCHSFGLGRLRCTFLNGATMVVIPSFADVNVFFNAIEKFHATGFGMVPAVWAYIRKFSGTRISQYAAQIKYIEIGSAAMPIESKRELCRLFPSTRICHHYGLTEASRAAFMEYHSVDDLDTIGREVCDKVEIKIIDGEICVKGNMVMKGYFLPEENATAFVDGYFKTGDEGYRDEKGNLHLVSRKKEMINVGGKKVSPIEVEDAVIAMGGVEDCGCVGVPDPNGILGEVPKLFVQRPGCSRTFEEIAAHLKGALESYKWPVAYEWIDAIPKTASGKKQRLQLKK